jgi:hypothetical protein
LSNYFEENRYFCQKKQRIKEQVAESVATDVCGRKALPRIHKFVLPAYKASFALRLGVKA